MTRVARQQRIEERPGRGRADRDRQRVRVRARSACRSPVRAAMLGLQTDGAAVGGPSFYSYLDASPVSIGKADTVDLMAAYRVVRISPPGVPERIPIDYITFIEWLLDYDRLVDPRHSTLGTRADRLRVGALTDLVALTRMAAGPEDLLKSLSANVKSLSPPELKQALSSAKAITRRVEAATKALEAAMAEGRKSSKT